MQRIQFEGCTCIVSAPEDIEQLERELIQAQQTIGKPPEGSHPDEMHPRAETWHQERQNWIAEINSMRSFAIEQEQTIAQKDGEIQTLRTHLEATLDWMEALRASGDALSSTPAPVAVVPWTKEIPKEQGIYWHWNGDEDSAPLPYHVMYSGTNGRCFVSASQYHIESAFDCEELGGWWLHISIPETPKKGNQ